MHPDAHTVAARDNAVEWLAHCADMLGAEASGLVTLQPDGGYDLISDGLDERAIAEYRDHYHRVDPLRALLDDRPAGRALVIDTTRHPAYLAQPGMSADFLRRHRIDHLLAAQWRQPDGSLRIIGLQRFRGSAPFPAPEGKKLDRIIHHWRVGSPLPPPQGFAARGGGGTPVGTATSRPSSAFPWWWWMPIWPSSGPTPQPMRDGARCGPPCSTGAPSIPPSSISAATCSNWSSPVWASAPKRNLCCLPPTAPGPKLRLSYLSRGFHVFST